MNYIQAKFVEFIPDQMEHGVLYISERFRTCSHRCCCGCGEEVVTPLSQAEWRLTREGELVSLWPSVGNWNYACRSHYFILRNRVRWSGEMSTLQIRKMQRQDAADLAKMVKSSNVAKANEKVTDVSPTPPLAPNQVPILAGKSKAGSGGKPAGIMKRLLRVLFGD